MSSDRKVESSRQPYLDYYADEVLEQCDRNDIVTNRNKDRAHGMKPFCDDNSHILTKKHFYYNHGGYRVSALKLSLRYNDIRDSCQIIIHPELAGHFHLLSPPLSDPRTIHKRFEYCIVLDTLAVYDSLLPETRKRNVLIVERVREETMKLGEEDMGSEELQEKFTELENALWEEVDDLSRFVPAESADIPPRKRECFPAQ